MNSTITFVLRDGTHHTSQWDEEISPAEVNESIRFAGVLYSPGGVGLRAVIVAVGTQVTAYEIEGRLQ